MLACWNPHHLRISQSSAEFNLLILVDDVDKRREMPSHKVRSKGRISLLAQGYNRNCPVYHRHRNPVGGNLVGTPQLNCYVDP